jgi:prepilin-type N-terminal cleavage/methylation domain-containing protein
MTGRLDKFVRRFRREDGFTLIEVLVAALILVLAAMATFGVLAAATRNAQRAQATQVALDKAQEEIEKLHAIPYSELALSVTPEYSNKPLNPNHRISGGEFALQREPPDEWAEMVVQGGSLRGGKTIEKGAVVPGPISFKEGNVSGKLYRYVVWRNDPTCPEGEAEEGLRDFCPGGQDYKQIIVAAQLNTPANETRELNYVEVQSQVSNPATRAQRSTQGNDSGFGGTGPGGKKEEEEIQKEREEDQTGGLGSGKAVTAQQFFLSDTPCSPTGTTVREEITGDHLLHNTLGVCASGLQTGESKQGAPDALVRGAPPDPDPEDESNPPLYDYSNDAFLEPPVDTDKGVQILHDDTAGCNYEPKSSVHPEAKVHRWVTDQMSQPFKLSGNVTLEFYSRTLGEASYPATVCAYLFIRSEQPPSEGKVSFTDDLLQDKETGRRYWTYSSQGTSSWPRTKWEKLRLTMKIEGTREVKVGERLGLALSVDAGSTPADGVPIMYDHPNYPTRLEVDTTTPIEGS